MLRWESPAIPHPAWFLTLGPALPLQEVGSELCGGSATAGGQVLFDAFSSGGAAAQAAVVALLGVECQQGDKGAIMQAAFNAFTSTLALTDPGTALRWAGAAVGAQQGCALQASMHQCWLTQ